MKPTLLRSPALLTAGLVSIRLASCLPAESAEPPRYAAESEKPASTVPSKPSRATEPKRARGPIIDGESFSVRQVIDRQQGNLPVGVYIAPESWRDHSEVVWNYGDASSPVKLSATVQNPTNSEALFSFSAAQHFSLRPDLGLYRPGQNYGGYVYTREPLSPEQSLLNFATARRGSSARFKVVGTKDLPELAKALQLPDSPHQKGVGIKVTYDLDGKPIEEEFYAVYYKLDIPYDGPQGRTWQINWGLVSPHSFRSPAGTLNRRRDVFAAIAKSFRPNPAWQERLTAINLYLQQEFNRQLQAGYDQIAAAGALSRQISANNDAMIASIDRRLAASRTTASTGTGSRSANDRFSDYIRGVETVDDPYYGTSQHASTESYHWTDGYGSYRHSNDPTLNPNQTEVGQWRLLEPTR